MLKLKFDIVYVDGRKDIDVETRVSTDVAFERRFGTSPASMFADMQLPDDATAEQKHAAKVQFLRNLRTEHLYFLAFHAAKAAGEFDDWLELVDEIDFKVADAVDPTPPDPSAGS